MIKAGVVRDDHVENNAMRFQRAARTDKGVSAAANVVNAKISIRDIVNQFLANKCF